MAKKESISVYNLELEKNLTDLQKYLQQADNKSLMQNKYCMFYPMIGKDYEEKRELLIYGQYVNNWKPTFKLTKDKTQAEAIVKKAYEQSLASKGCPLDWVNKNWIKKNIYRSFFWNITYKLVMERYGRSETDWNHIITYSNLLKIAPATDNEMPEEVFKAQLPHSAHLFKEELSILQPKNVVLITNLHNWAEPVLKTAGIRFKTEDEEYVQATAAYRGSNIIVTKRPFNASHREFLDAIKRNMV